MWARRYVQDHAEEEEVELADVAAPLIGMVLAAGQGKQNNIHTMKKRSSWKAS